MHTDPELLAALELAVQFMNHLMEQHEQLVGALRVGRPRSDEALHAMAEQLATDRNDLVRFERRLRQLQSVQRPH